MDMFSVLCVVLAGVSWGTAGVFSYVLKPMGFDAFQIAMCRSLFAGLMMFVFILCYNPKILKISLKRLVLIAVSGFGLWGTAAFYYWAMDFISYAPAVILMYTAPIMVMVISVLFLGEKFNLQKLIGLVGAIVGCCFVTGIFGQSDFNLAGIGIGLLSGVSYCLYNICVKLEMKRGDDPIGATAYCFLFAFLFAMIAGKPVRTVEMLIAQPVAIWWMLGIGFFVGVFPYLLYTFAMRKIPAGVASCMACIEPMTATVVSVCFLGETLTLSAIIGIVLILGSVILISREK